MRERDIHQDETYIEAFLDAFDDVLYTHTVDGDLLDWNRAVNEVTGYTDDEIRSMNALDFFEGEDRDVIRRGIEEAVETGGARREADLVTKDGDEIPYEFVANRLEDIDGNQVIAGIGREITERKEYEEELERTRDRLEEAQRVAGMGHWVSDFEEIEWSDEVYSIFGVEPGEVDPTHERWLEFVHPDDRDRVEDAVDEALEEDNYDIQHRIVRPNGEVRVVHERGDVQYDDDGDPVRMIGTVQDITRERRIRSLLNSIRDIAQGVLEADTADEVYGSTMDVLSSREGFGYDYACASIGVFGDDGREVERIYDAGMIADDDEECEVLWREIYTSDYVDEVFEKDVLVIDDVTQPPYEQHGSYDRPVHGAVSVPLRHRDDDYGVMTLHLPPDRDADDGSISEDEVRLVEEMAHDVSLGVYSVEAEERLERERDELALLNRIVRHDIRNDMNLVLGWGDILRDYVEDDGEEYLETVLDMSRHVVDLTKTARDYVESVEMGEEAEVEPIRLRETVENSVRKRRETYPSTDFVVDSIPDVDVEANDLLSTVFRNLLNNAVQHNDSEEPRVEVSAEEEDGEVVVTVADNGPGVPDDLKDEIFGKGERGLESEGTGVGLYLAKTVVESYGGEIWVEDSDLGGADFKVSLRKT
ncbi:MAG: PAS domain-containing protein [Halobacteria archaeon]|nr:PAS domain-containing protein [Halobacteria archaeon]